MYVLEQYYRDFPVYNPALLHIPSRSTRMKQISSQNFKVYDVDGKEMMIRETERSRGDSVLAPQWRELLAVVTPVGCGTAYTLDPLSAMGVGMKNLALPTKFV